MSVTARSTRRVRRTLSRLRAEYGAFETARDVWELSVEEYRGIHERFEAGTIGGAGAWVRNDDGAVLLVREAGVESWSEPAGKHEPGESLEETARREVREETGVDCRLTGVELVQVVTMRAPDRPPLLRLIVTFGGVYEGGTIEPAENEIAAAEWWATRPPALQYDALEYLPV